MSELYTPRPKTHLSSLRHLLTLLHRAWRFPASVGDVLDAAARGSTGKPFPHRGTRLVTLVPESRPANSRPQRKSKGDTHVQGSQQISRGRAGGRRLHRSWLKMGKSLSHRSRRRSGSSDRQNTSAGSPISTIFCARWTSCAVAISSASALQRRATATSCCGSPTRRARSASLGGAKRLVSSLSPFCRARGSTHRSLIRCCTCLGAPNGQRRIA